MILRSLSWEGPGLLCLGIQHMKPRYFQRAEGRIQGTPDIAFVGKEARWQPLENVEVYPEEIVVQEKSGGHFKYFAL